MTGSNARSSRAGSRRRLPGRTLGAVVEANPLLTSDQPTIIEVWAPSCVECRAMQPDLDDVATEFAGSVRLVMVNVAEDLELARSLGAMATPTLIGIAEGRQMFRLAGRRSRTELTELFSAVASGEPAKGIGRQDRNLRLGSAAALVVSGALSGPAWPLIGVGAAIAAWALSAGTGNTHE